MSRPRCSGRCGWARSPGRVLKDYPGGTYRGGDRTPPCGAGSSPGTGLDSGVVDTSSSKDVVSTNRDELAQQGTPPTSTPAQRNSTIARVRAEAATAPCAGSAPSTAPRRSPLPAPRPHPGAPCYDLSFDFADKAAPAPCRAAWTAAAKSPIAAPNVRTPASSTQPSASAGEPSASNSATKSKGAAAPYAGAAPPTAPRRSPLPAPRRRRDALPEPRPQTARSLR